LTMSLLAATFASFLKCGIICHVLVLPSQADDAQCILDNEAEMELCNVDPLVDVPAGLIECR